MLLISHHCSKSWYYWELICQVTDIYCLFYPQKQDRRNSRKQWTHCTALQKIIELSRSHGWKSSVFFRILYLKNKILSKNFCISCGHFSKALRCIFFFCSMCSIHQMGAYSNFFDYSLKKKHKKNLETQVIFSTQTHFYFYGT